MAYLDYSPVQLTDTTEGMRRLGDSLTSAMKRKQEREQFEQKQVFEREQEQRRLSQQQQQYDYLNKIEERKNRMAEIEFSRKQQADVDARMDRARKAQTPQEAEAIVNGIIKYDPHTGKEIGRGKLTPGEIPDVGPAPQTPTAPTAPAFPAKEAAGVIPDIAQALPGAPPELAAAMRGRQRAAAPPISLDNPQSDPAVEARMRAEQADMAAKAPQRQGKMFVDQINDEGIATLLTDDGSKVHVRAKKGWAEGQYIGPDGQPEAQDNTRRFDPSVQGTRFEDDAAPDRFQAATDAFSNYQGEQQALPGKQKAYAQEMQAFPGKQSEYETKVRNAESRRPYTMAVGDEPGVTFDFDTQRRGNRVQAAQDFVDTVGQMNLTPAQQEAAKFARVAILNGSNPDAVMKQFQQERTLGIKQDYGHAEGLLRDKNRLEVAKVPRPGITLQERRFGFDEGKERSKLLRADMEKFMTRHGAKTVQEDNLQMPQIIRSLNGNPQQQRNAMIQMWQMAQHDHRFSDQDAVMSQIVDPSVMGRIEGWISQKTEGKLAPDIQQMALQTAGSMKQFLDGKVAQLQDLAKETFIESGQYDPQEADVYMRQQIPGWQRMFPNGYKEPPAGGGPPEIDAKRKGKKKKGGGSSTTIKAPSTDEALRLREAMQ